MSNGRTSGLAFASLALAISGLILIALAILALGRFDLLTLGAALFPLPVCALAAGLIALSKIRKSGGRLRGRTAAMGGLVLAAIGVALAPLWIYTVHKMITDPEAFVSETAAEINAGKALAAMTSYNEAQRKYYAMHQKYARDLDGLAQAKLLAPAVAAARPGKRPYAGYYFVAIEKADGEPIRPESGYALCAYPQTYGEQARLTFITNEEDDIYKKDTGGKAVTDYPEDPEEVEWEIDWPSELDSGGD